jgi:hypothetical protein
MAYTPIDMSYAQIPLFTRTHKNFGKNIRKSLPLVRFPCYLIPAMSNPTTTTTARPYFTAETSFQSPETLAEARLTDLISLRKESAFYLKKGVDCPPAYREVMRGIELEARDLQYRVAMLMASGEKLAQLLQETEEKIAAYQETFENEGEASEEFAFSDAKVLVEEAYASIENWVY